MSQVDPHVDAANVRELAQTLSALDQAASVLPDAPASRKVRALLRKAIEQLRSLYKPLTVTEASDILDVSRPTVYAWVRQGLLRAVEYHGRARLDAGDVAVLASELATLRAAQNIPARQVVATLVEEFNASGGRRSFSAHIRTTFVALPPSSEEDS